MTSAALDGGCPSLSQDLDNIKLSVVIPAYNASHHIEESLTSVFNQSNCSQFEVIVVDDGSMDCTYEIVRNNFPSVRLFRKQNGGPGSARNLGAGHARGEILVFHDADDVMLPGRLSTQGQFMLTNPQVMLSVGNCWFQGRPGYDRIGTAGIASGEEFNIVSNAYGAFMAKDNVCGGGVIAVRKDAFFAIGGFREDTWVEEDHALGLEIARKWPIAASCRFLTWYRQEGRDHLMVSERRWRDPVLYKMEELVSHGHLLKSDEYTIAYRKWRRLADRLVRRTWADFGRRATLREIEELRPLLPRTARWKWQALSLIPPIAGRTVRYLKRSLLGRNRGEENCQ